MIKSNRYLLLVIVPCLSLLSACGGLNEDKILALQEKAYQSGISCMKQENLHACSDFATDLGVVSDELNKHAVEFKKKLDNGNKKCDQILFNSRKIISLSKTIIE